MIRRILLALALQALCSLGWAQDHEREARLEQETLATLVVGFAPFDPPAGHSGAGVVRGIWSAGRLHLPALAPDAAGALANQLAHHLTAANQTAW